MRVIATASGIDDRGIRQDAGSEFNCPKNGKGEEIRPRSESNPAGASWYVEKKEEQRSDKKGDGKNLVG